MIVKNKTTKKEDSRLRKSSGEPGDDLLLIERILEGEERALTEFYHLYYPKLSNYIRQKVENVSDGEEILQDSLLAVIEALRDFSGRSSLSTFVFAIVHNKVVDYYRRKKIKQVLFSKVPELENIISELLKPEDAFEEKLLKDKIKRTFERLEPKYRIVLILKYIEELPVVEIAKRISGTVKMAESRLFRARKAFVKLYSE